ncbi:MAG: hypothetical protein Q8R91_02490 [Candidatus Omnitrophota bacterium]|nr:hypothetical protein [Candidatus Omnitrophota bacterium]
MKTRLLLAIIAGGSWLSSGFVPLVGATEFRNDEVVVSTDKHVYRVNEPIEVWATYTNPEERQWLWRDGTVIRRFEATASVVPLDKAWTTPPLVALGLNPISNLKDPATALPQVMVDSRSQYAFAHRVLSTGLSTPGRYLVKLAFFVTNSYPPGGEVLLTAYPSTIIEVK